MEGLSAAWPEFTVAQVAAHNKPDDCWVVVDGWVCDVTAYMAVHPGGKQLIARSAGLDVTRDFAAMFHSSRARTKMLELVVGRLAGSRAPQHLDPLRAAATPLPRKGMRAAEGPAPPRGPYGFAAPAAVALPAARLALRVDAYVALRLLRKTRETPDCWLLAFELPVSAPSTLLACQHVRVEAGGVARSYTPVAWRRGSFDLVVKRYPEPHGALSRLLCDLEPDQSVNVMGPLASGFDWLKATIKYRAAHPTSTGPLVLVSMGTGLTPMLQLLRDVHSREWSRGKPMRVILCHASQSPEHLFLVKELQELQALASSAWLRVHHFFTSEHRRLTAEAVRELLLAEPVGVGDAVAVCCCGTDAFVNSFREAELCPSFFAL